MEKSGKTELYRPKVMIGIVASLAIVWLCLVAVFSLLAALVCRGGLFFWALGLAVVKNNGAPASRLRVLWRTVVAWSPLALFVFSELLVVGILKEEPSSEYVQGAILIGTLGAALYTALVLASALLPGRGIPDRLAGTWLVPR